MSTDERQAKMGDTDFLARVTQGAGRLVCTYVKPVTNFVPSFSGWAPASDATTILRSTTEVR
jgi:hypothetical protein